MSCTSSSFNAQQRNAKSVVQNASRRRRRRRQKQRPIAKTDDVDALSGGGGAHRIDGDAIFLHAGLVQRGTNRCLMSRARRTSRNTNVKVEAKAGTANDGGKERHQQSSRCCSIATAFSVETEELQIGVQRVLCTYSVCNWNRECKWSGRRRITTCWQNTVGGGKPKNAMAFKENTWPTVTKSDKYGTGMVTDEGIQDQLIDDLQDKKTEFIRKSSRKSPPREEGF